MASSQTQFDKNLEETKEVEVPIGVINLTLDYDDDGLVLDKINSHKNVPLVSTLFNTRKTACLKDLLTAVVSGDPNKVKAMLEKSPSLVLEKLKKDDFVKAPSGHKFNLTPYQAALAVEDYEIAKLIEPFFEDKEEMKRQFNVQCPQGRQPEEKEKWEPIFKQLKSLLNIILYNQNEIILLGAPEYIATPKEGSKVEKALFEFWRLLDATLDEVVTVGKRPFNPNLLLLALQRCKGYEHFGSKWDQPDSVLCLQKVVGYYGLQRFLPVNYVQAYQDRLYDTAEKLKDNQPQGRSACFKLFDVKKWDWNSLPPINFYPLQSRAAKNFHFALNSFGARIGYHDRVIGLMRPSDFEHLLVAKEHQLEQLKQLCAPSQRRCTA